MFKRIALITIILLSFLQAYDLSQEVQSIISLQRQAKNILSVKPDSAITLLNRTLIIGSRIESDSLSARSHYFLGIAYYYLGQYYTSIFYYRKALNSLYAERNLNFRSKCLNNLGVDYELSGKYDEGIRAYLKSMDIDSRRGDATGVAQTEINIGLLYLELSQTEKAGALFLKALRHFKKVNDPNGMALAYHNLGKRAFDLHRPDSALIYLKRAKQLYKESGNFYEYNHTLIFLARTEIIREHYNAAGSYIARAMRIARTHDYRGQMAAIRLLNAKIFLRKGQFRKARAIVKNIHHVNKISEKNKKLLELQLLAAEKSPAVFESALNGFMRYLDSLQIKSANQIVSQLQIRYETENKIRTINNQKKLITAQKTKIYYLMAGVLTLCLMLALYLRLYLKLRKSYRKLYENSKKCYTGLRKEINQSVEKTKKNRASNALWPVILNTLEQKKLYTDPELTIDKVALACNSNKTYISREIKKQAHVNFNHFINRLRIEAVINRLPDTHLSMEAIARECGFKSTSTFYRSFREETGLTPRQYLSMAVEKKDHPE